MSESRSNKPTPYKSRCPYSQPPLADCACGSSPPEHAQAATVEPPPFELAGAYTDDESRDTDKMRVLVSDSNCVLVER